jgi:peroxiredoxin Q/BCP
MSPNHTSTRHATYLAILFAIGLTALSPQPTTAIAALAAEPQVGEKARDFTLATVDGTRVTLSHEFAEAPIVLVVLRGWPGYQCPFCTRQFGDFLVRAKEFETAGARVVFVYPGATDDVKLHAKEFIASGELPSHFRFLIDPAYVFTNAYGLRWDAPSETAYPSTFVIDRQGTVRFAHISHAHDGRARAAEVLKALAKIAR